MAGLLAMSPLALLIPQSGTGSEHGGSGDLILAVDGKRIHNHEEFQQQTKDLRPGDIVYLSVLRDGQGLRQVPVQLTTHPGTTTAMVR
jgi:S1-C subfamily serine protease